MRSFSSAAAIGPRPRLKTSVRPAIMAWARTTNARRMLGSVMARLSRGLGCMHMLTSWPGMRVEARKKRRFANLRRGLNHGDDLKIGRNVGETFLPSPSYLFHVPAWLDSNAA